jgi:hypothetical protein
MSQPQHYFRDDLTKIVTTNVCDYGWHGVNVIEDDGCPPWTFTIGLYEAYGFPELIIIGRSRATAHHILESIAHRLEKNEPPDLTVPALPLLPGIPCLFREVLPRYYADYVGFALWFYRKRQFPLYQIVWPNNENLYPWDRNASKAFKEWQPALFELR